MKKITTSIILSAALTCSGFAQDLPKPSPLAKVQQRVGLTDISIEYSRPGAKGRSIWNDLVPYGEIWRAGANKATQFTTSSDIEINGMPLPEGSYSLFIIPSDKAPWTVIFNTETELWGAGDYNEDKDQLRIEVKPQAFDCEAERLEYHFTDVDMDGAKLSIDWAGKRLYMDITADATEQVVENIKQAIEESSEEDMWRVYRNAASYAEDAGMTDKGLEWIKKSVEMKDNWYSYWVYSNLLAQKKMYREAVEKAEKAIKVGKAEAKDTDDTFTYESRIMEDIDKWNGMK